MLKRKGWSTQIVRNRGGSTGGQPREYVTANTCYAVGTPQHTVSSKCDLEQFPKLF